jgi:hypothetical protein
MSAPAGTRGAEYEMLVEQGKIREFAAATRPDGPGEPAYHGPDAVVPPTFLVSGALWAPPDARVEVGFDRRRLLHGEQEYVFHGPPPRAGQTLTARDRIENRYEKPGKRGGTMRFAVVVTEYRADDGTLVAEARATYIETAPRAGEAS